MSEPMTPSFSRCDLSVSALIFGGVLVALTAVGGALDGSARWVDEIKVAVGENAKESDDLDMWSACKNASKESGTANVARRCRERAIRASFH